MLCIGIFTNSISLTVGYCKEPSGSKKEAISYLFFVPSTGLIGCSYFATSFKERGKISFFSIEEGKEINSILLDVGEDGGKTASSHDGKLIGIGSTVWGEQISSGLQSIRIACYSIAQNKWLWRANWPDWEETHKDVIQSVIFTRDDRRIVAAGKRSVVVYDATTGEVLRKWRDPFKDYPNWRFDVTQVAFSANGRYLVIWQEYKPWHLNDYLFWFMVNREVTVWDIQQDKLVARWRKPEELYWGGVLSDEVIFGSRDGYIRIWSISEQKMLRKWKAYWGRDGYNRYAYSSHLMALTVSQDGKYIATKGYGVDRPRDQDTVKNVIKIWNLETERFIREFADIEYGVFGKYPMVFSSDSRYFAFDQKGRLCLYDAQTWERKWCVPNAGGDKN